MYVRVYQSIHLNVLMITLLKYIFLDTLSWQKKTHIKFWLLYLLKAEIKLYTNMDKIQENYNIVQNLSLTFYGKLNSYSVKIHFKFAIHV